MRKGTFYKHPNCTDTCIEVLSAFTVPEHNSIKVRVRWWRVRFGKIDYCMGIQEKFEKPIEYWKQWKVIRETHNVSI
jgi:hypothetical protein